MGTNAGALLTLDLASRTGWACGLPGAGLDGTEPLRFGSFKMSKPGMSDGQFFYEFESLLRDIITVHKPTRICWEAPFIRAGGKQNLQTAKRLMGLSTIVDKEAWRIGIRGDAAMELNNQTLKRWFTGSGKAEKHDMAERARQLGHDIMWHDEADAIAGWYFAENWYFPKLGARRLWNSRPLKS